ncbi:hypothetical protein BDV23DRAFT_3594 [Aspergillus alliaceus]|uniref:Uncharacterized protein n=1 Tax=Petromyces alliaceus TaxID=209559 RepID=A0A5N6FWU0_PETAA|nr:uncharacterized protein BDW43DRAFT_311009 [Aspergillus alliaceus]KAB8233665.1 hypothetical protein BDW43DRAFT_311009 [Aspergillus alliaceus]KAE8396678.1 hypothetical protein BDV23DRAFT_3594 [Aspergillus alliaceus]
MKSVQLSLLALLFQASSIQAKGYKKNIPTYEVGPDAVITGNTIVYNDPDCDPGFQCKLTKTCTLPLGSVPTLTSDKKYFACCLPGLNLLGSPETAFDCCAVGHGIAGSPEVGYRCCPTGQTYDGLICKPVCQNGKVLVDGKCVCPKGTVEGPNGTCREEICTSGLASGKCYTFTAPNGNTLGSGEDGIYYARPDDMNFHYGKFQLCLDEKCAAGTPINPQDGVYIRDLYGDVKTGANKGQWLNNAKDGAHIGKTKDFASAGKFSLSKWPCGKYCLGGVEWGVGPACPSQTPAITFFSQDPQMCTAFDLTEIPCDIKAPANNCIWKSGKNQCCGKVDCSQL